MSFKINFQYLFSYLGIVPFVLIIIDKFFFLLINADIYKNFVIYYTTLIIVFIGSINWNLKEKIKTFIVFYGFIPSFFSSIIIILNLYNYSFEILYLLLITILLLQLICDYFIIYSKNKNAFYFLRLPLTLGIAISLVFILM